MRTSKSCCMLWISLTSDLIRFCSVRIPATSCFILTFHKWNALRMAHLAFCQCNRMSFGLCNAQASSQRLMESCMGELNLMFIFITFIRWTRLCKIEASVHLHIHLIKIEPRHDKTNKMACVPSEDSDQTGHPPSLIRVFAFRMKKAWILSYPLSTQRKFWSDWADAQADLSLRWAHTHFVGFVMWLIKLVIL